MPKTALNEEKQGQLRLIRSLIRVLREMPGRRRGQFWLILTAMVCLAGLEVVFLGVVAFFASSVADPGAVLHSSQLAKVQWALPGWALSNARSLVFLLSGIVVLLLLIKNVFAAWVMYWSRRYSASVDGFFGKKILEGFLRLPYLWHLYQNSADLILMIQWRINFGSKLVFNTLKLLSDSLIVVFMLLALLVVQPYVSLAVLVVLGGFSIGIFTVMRRALDKTAIQTKDLNGSINRHASRALQGIKDVKIYGREQNFMRDYIEEVFTLAHLEAKQNVLTLSPRWLLESAGFIALTLAICLMLFFMQASPATVTGTIALLAVTAWKSLPAIVRILSNITMIRNALPYVDRGFRYLDEVKGASGRKSHAKGRCADFKFERAIALKDVSFSYDQGRPAVLRDINITIAKGKTIGVIGPSGAGKSTLVDVLVGLLKPGEGELLVDDVPLDSERASCWIRSIGYVPQDPFIYDGTLAENVAFGLRGAEIDRDKVLDCCAMAAVSEFMDLLPEGMDTQIGERGTRLSGGQQQRVAIARALYNEPQVMVFDEATSSLDTKSELEIQKTIYSFKGKLTLVIIAHRLSTVKNCDAIVWLERGAVRMTGPPAEVLTAYDQAQGMHAARREKHST